jgi:hypothetical protein
MTNVPDPDPPIPIPIPIPNPNPNPIVLPIKPRPIPTIDMEKYKYRQALVVGATYADSKLPFAGSDYNALLMEDFLLDCGFLKEEITLMIDTNTQLDYDGSLKKSNKVRPTNLYPTKENIIKQLQNIVTYCENVPSSRLLNTLIVVYFAGHGSYFKDKNGDEVDQLDELFVTNNIQDTVYVNDTISDDFFYTNLVSKLNRNVFLLGLFDTNYSGTMFDLKYQYLHMTYQRVDVVIDSYKRTIIYDKPSTTYKIANSSDDSSCLAITIGACEDYRNSISYRENNKPWKSLFITNLIESYRETQNIFALLDKMQIKTSIFNYKYNPEKISNIGYIPQKTVLCCNKEIILDYSYLFSNISIKEPVTTVKPPPSNVYVYVPPRVPPNVPYIQPNRQNVTRQRLTSPINLQIQKIMQNIKKIKQTLLLNQTKNKKKIINSRT